MIFLIEYNRSEGRLISLKSFPDASSNQAETERLNIEILRNREGIETEVALLQAESEAALKKSHRRYFEDFKQLLQSAVEQVDRLSTQAPGLAPRSH